MDEQDEVVRRGSEMLEMARRSEQRIAAARTQVQQISAGVLEKTFKGQLVPQDAGDEPASELLRRREERPTVPEPRQRARPRLVAQAQEPRTKMKQLAEVLMERRGWMTSQEAFKGCGVGDGSRTDHIESLYAELRELERSKRVLVEPVRDAKGRKLYDRLKYVAKT